MPRFLPSRAFSLTCLAALSLFASTAHALQVVAINAQNKHGQTFITWSNLPGSGWTYHVYASLVPIRTSTDFFDNAWELGSVGDSSSLDRRISSLLGTTLSFSTDSGGTPMPLSRGLFVTTPTESGLMNYTILAESALYPMDYHFYPGQNTTVDPVWEIFATPRPIWQRKIAAPACDHYILFASSNDVTGLLAMWPKENHALHFGVVRGKPGGALVLRGHGRGHSFFSGVQTTGHADETVIAPDDYLATWDVASWFFGYNNTYDPNVGNNPYASSGTVVDYIDRFVTHLIGWGQANFGTDPNRTYALGTSMGGSFAFYLAWHHPDLVAASMAVVPKTCARYVGDTSPTLTATFERMWSPFTVDLPTIEGVPVFEWMDGRSLAERYRRRGASPVIAFAGRNDLIVSWQEKPLLFQALENNRAGETWFWDNREHVTPSTQTQWEPEQMDEQQLYRYRLDRSYPALSRCSANSNPGDGSLTSGDTLGTLNGFVQWDEDFVDTQGRWECVLRPHALQTRNGTLAPPANITVDVTPRRLQNFQVSDRTEYAYTVSDATTGVPVTSGILQADADYLITAPAIPVLPGGTRLAITPVGTLGVGDAAGLRLPRLALASNPVRGATTLQIDWPAVGDARVELFDLAGRRARTLFHANGRGTTAVTLDATGLAPGVYMVHARQGSLESSARVVVVR